MKTNIDIWPPKPAVYLENSVSDKRVHVNLNMYCLFVFSLLVP